MTATTVPPTTTRGALANDWAPRVLSIVRIVVALLFMEHGIQKLFGFPAATMQPGVFSLLWFVAIIELVGGVLLLVGLFARGDAAILYCFVFLYLAVAGAGAWSVDAARHRA